MHCSVLSVGWVRIRILELPRITLEKSHAENSIDDQPVIAATGRWVEKAVIGLELCPFAATVVRHGLLRLRVSPARTAAGLLADLEAELLLLHATDPGVCETTLLIHPGVLTDFVEFNDFLQICDQTVRDLGLEGEIQVASFHPHYQFAGTRPGDIENHTNRSPHPTLHLLREASVERALSGVTDPESIYLANIVRLRELGLAGWEALWAEDSKAPD